MDAAEDTRKARARDCVLLLSLAFLLRLGYLVVMPRVLDSADAIHYIETARYFAQGGFWGFNPKIPILYPALAALLSPLVPDLEIACTLVSFVASVLLVIPVYGLARDLHGRSSARVAALTVAIWPWLIDYAGRVGVDALGCTLWFASVWLFARGLRHGGLWLAAAVVAFFALHLTRPEGTVLIAAAFVAAPLLCGKAGRRQLRRLVPFAVACGGLLLIYALYMKSLTGAATINYRAHFIVEEFAWARMVKTGVRTFANVLPVMLGPLLLIFMGAGLFQPASADGARRDFRLEAYVLFFAFVQWAASLSVLSAEPRYLMSVIVALSLWSARGVVLVSRQAAVARYGRWLRILPVAALVALMLFGTAVSVAAAYRSGQPGAPLEYRTAGQWMRANLEPGLIFTRKPQIGYYAGMPSTGPDLNDTLPQAIARARSAGARYLIVDERYTAQMVHSLAPLLDPTLAPPDLRLLKVFSEYPQCRVAIYEMGE